MSAAALVVGALFLSVLLGLGLYVLVRAEHDDRRVMEREQAERVARRDTRDSADETRPPDDSRRGRR